MTSSIETNSYAMFESIYNNYTKDLLANSQESFKQFIKDNIRIKNCSYFPKHGIESKELKILDKKGIYKFFIEVFRLEEDKLIKLFRAAILIYSLKEKKDIKYICEYLKFNIEKIDSNLRIAKKYFIFEKERIAVEEYELKLENINFVKKQITTIENKIKKINSEIRKTNLQLKENTYSLLIGKEISYNTSSKGKKYYIGQNVEKEDLDHLYKYKYSILVFVREHFNNDIINTYENELEINNSKIKQLKNRNIIDEFEKEINELNVRLEHLKSNALLDYHL